MIQKEHSNTTLEINQNNSLFPPSLISKNYSPKKENKVKIQIGGDEIPTLSRKPGIDSEPLLTTITQNSTSLNNLPPPIRRNNSHHSFFGLTYHSSKEK